METIHQLFYDEVGSPVGKLLLVSNGEQMIRIDFGSMDALKEPLTKWANRYLGNISFTHQPEKVQRAGVELHEYFMGERQEFSFNLAFYGTTFQKKVWQALIETIPFGATKTYKDIAIAAGSPKAVRAVGGAVNKNPFSIVAPCHRVIGTNGKMVGYGGGLDKKEYLLAHERNV